MKDIVELLRNAETSVKWPDGSVDLVIHVAADEIERLREALRRIADTEYEACGGCHACCFAKEALGKDK